MKTVVIAAMGRSGSTMIAETMALHPAIFGGGELFHHDEVIRKGCHHALTGDGGAFAYFPGHYTRPDLYVDLLAAMARYRGKTVLSFKLMESQCPQLVPMLASRRTHFIHCYRANFIAAVASWKLAQATGIWHTRNEEVRASKIKGKAPVIKITPQEVEDWGNRNTAFEALLKSTGIPIHSLPYVEETRGDPGGTVRSIFDLIEVAPIQVEPAQVRVNRRSLAEVVENMAELRKHFDGTSWAWMTRDKENR